MPGGVWTIVAGLLAVVAGRVLVRELESVRVKTQRAGGDTARLDATLESKLFRYACPTIGVVGIIVGVALLAT